MPSVNTQKDLLRELEWFSVPAPRSLRETFQLFGLYDSEQGLPGLLDRVQFAGVVPDQICRAVLGRPPQDIAECVPESGYDPRRLLQDTFLSPEFQSRIVANLLTAYPEQRRDVFIHVPKCAGTDLILNLGQQRQKLPLPVMLGTEAWISKDELFRTLRSLVHAIPYHDAFFVYGHHCLEDYVAGAGIRGSDRIFTILRDPLDLLISQANYAITRLRQDPGGKQPDVQETLAVLGIERLPEPIALNDLRSLALRLLLDERIVLPNPLCFYLGGPEASARFDKAMTHIIAYDVEVTTTRQYPAWLWQSWHIMPHSQHNQSDHWLSPNEIGADLAAQLEKRLGEDRKLFGVVSGVLEELGTTSVTGSQIAHRFGSRHYMVTGEFDSLGPALRSVGDGQGRGAGEPVVVSARDAIVARMADRPFGPPLVGADFGAEGKGQPLLRQGWAAPETGFTWTIGPTCAFDLPKPIGGENYLLRLVGGPFVVKDRLPNQRITLAANGVVLGTATANERSLIEWELPNAVLGGLATTTYTLWLPDAAAPSDISGIADDRLLGFALERVEIVLASQPEASSDTLSVVQGEAAIDRYLRRRAHLRPVLRLLFGDKLEDGLLLKEGWAIPETGFTWTAARFSHCETSRPVPVQDYRMRITAGAFVCEDIWPTQRIGISVNGFQLAAVAVSDRTIVECPLPAAALKPGEAAVFSFGLPDAVRPRSIGASEDDRLLGFAVESIELFREAAEQPMAPAGEVAPSLDEAPRQAAKSIPEQPAAEPRRVAELAPPAGSELAASDLMMQFESLGENCEFGLVQRRCGAEPLGLFRFSSAPLPKLMAALDARFDGFGAPEKISVELSSNGREYMVHDGQYGFLYHAWVLADEMQPDEIRRREGRRLPLLIRKLVEDLTVGRKLLVVRGMDQPLEAGEVERLLTVLRRYGPNTLLWVVLADPAHPAGSVERAGPNLLKGYIDRFAPGENAHDLSLDCWVAICREAYRLWRQQSVAAAPVSAAAE